MADGSITLTTKVDESGLKSGLSSLKTGIGSVTGVVAGVGAAVVGMTAAVVNGAKQTAAFGDNIDKTSQKLGISSEAFQKWDYVMNISGTSMNNMQMGMKTLTNKLDDAKNGSTGAMESFQKLGFSMEDLNSMTREEVFEKAIYGFQGMADSTERAALANEIFGRSGQELTPLFNQTAESTQELMQRAIDYGMVMSEDAVQASAAFNDSLTTLGMTTTGLKNKMMAEFLPALTDVTDGLALLMTGDTSGLDKISKGVSKFVDKLTEVLPKVLEFGVSIIENIAKAILDNLPQLVTAVVEIMVTLTTNLVAALPQILETGIQILLTLIQGLTDALPDLIAMLPTIITTIVTVLIQNLPAIIQAGLELLFAVIDGLVKAIPDLVNYVPTIVTTIIEVLIENLPLLVDCAIELMVALINGLVEALPKLVEMTPQIIITIVSTLIANLPKLLEAGVKMLQSVIDGLNSILHSMGEIGKNIVNGLWNGIINTKDWLLNKIKSFAKSITDGIKSFFGIKSPSRVFRDEVGKNLMLGMAEGISRNEATVMGAMSRVASGIADTSFGLPDIVSSGVVPYNVSAAAVQAAPTAGQFMGTASETTVIREEHYYLSETELMTVLHKLVKGGARLQGASLVSGGSY